MTVAAVSFTGTPYAPNYAGAYPFAGNVGVATGIETDSVHFGARRKKQNREMGLTINRAVGAWRRVNIGTKATVAALLSGVYAGNQFFSGELKDFLFAGLLTLITGEIAYTRFQNRNNNGRPAPVETFDVEGEARPRRGPNWDPEDITGQQAGELRPKDDANPGSPRDNTF